jgi:hypothetical protein
VELAKPSLSAVAAIGQFSFVDKEIRGALQEQLGCFNQLGRFIFRFAKINGCEVSARMGFYEFVFKYGVILRKFSAS